jgi:hypothetical protein
MTDDHTHRGDDVHPVEAAMREDEGGWQLITTAPVDGAEFLVYNSYCGEQFVCFWDGLDLRYGLDCSAVIDLDYGVTHWMPLPAAPTEGE